MNESCPTYMYDVSRVFDRETSQVSNIPAGALLFRLGSWLAHGFDGAHADASPQPPPTSHMSSDDSTHGASPSARADKVTEKVMLLVLDGLGRGEEGGVWEHPDSTRVVLAVTRLVLDAAARVRDEGERVVHARQAALMSGAKFRTPAAASGACAARHAALLRVASKAAETLGRFAMLPLGARAICAQADIVIVFQSLLILARASGDAMRGSLLAQHMLLSQEQVCRDLALRVLLPPHADAAVHKYTQEQGGRQILDQLMTSLVRRLAPRLHHHNALLARCGGGVDDEDEDEEEEQEAGVNVDDCLAAVAGLSRSADLLVLLELHPRLPLLMLRLVCMGWGGAGWW